MARGAGAAGRRARAPRRPTISTGSPAVTGVSDRASQRAPSAKIFPAGAMVRPRRDDEADEDPVPGPVGKPLNGDGLEREGGEDRRRRGRRRDEEPEARRAARRRSREKRRTAPRMIETAPPMAKKPCPASFTSRRKKRRPRRMRPIPTQFVGRTDRAKSAEQEADAAEDARQDRPRVLKLGSRGRRGRGASGGRPAPGSR